MQWLDTWIRRDLRERRAPGEPPAALGLLDPAQRDLLARWVRKDHPSRTRQALLREAGAADIECAEALCDRLLRDGWISRRERLSGGRWQWQSVLWRDLPTLKRLLGVGSRAERDAARERLLEHATAWVAARRGREGGDADFDVELEQALGELREEPSPRVDALEARVRLLRALAAWCDARTSGSRRDFALHAGVHTKSVGAADWKWLERGFDLERLGIRGFAPLMWLSGEASLCWGARRLDLSCAGFVGIALDDLVRATAIHPRPANWWLIENRASFERQAATLPGGRLLAWLPGRPSSQWLDTLCRLSDLAPAPLLVSADADPAGMDIALAVGREWERRRMAWSPHRMGVAEWRQATQHWPLNDYDRALLPRLLQRDDLPESLRALGELMLREGRKAEQEAWL